MRRLLTNPVLQLLVVGAVALVGIVLVTGRLSSSAAAEEAVSDAASTTQLLAHSVAEPAIPRGLVDGDPGAIDRFDRRTLERLMVGTVRRIKIWRADGTVVYSDKVKLLRKQWPLGEDELEVIRNGGTDAEVSDLSRPENRFERGQGGMLEVYTRIVSPEGEPLLFEVYYSSAEIAQRRTEVFRSFRPITLGALAVLLAVAIPLVWRLTRKSRRDAEERERLLRAAVDASDAERLRIARDLHDGVVQELAGTAFAVSAMARRHEVPPDVRGELDGAGGSLRTSLRGLRSLLVEIYPPDLHAAGLTAALNDLLAPAAAAGIEVSLSVEGAEDVPDDVVALVWRVAQESVRNATRHADPHRIDVSVRRLRRGIVLEVVDDGRGFDPAEARSRASFGLRGLSSLIAEAGGRLDVQSRPGAGTTIRLEVTP